MEEEFEQLGAEPEILLAKVAAFGLAEEVYDEIVDADGGDVDQHGGEVEEAGLRSGEEVGEGEGGDGEEEGDEIGVPVGDGGVEVG